MSSGSSFPPRRVRGRGSGAQARPLFLGLGRGPAWGDVSGPEKSALTSAPQERDPEITSGESVDGVEGRPVSFGAPGGGPSGRKGCRMGKRGGECSRGPSGWGEPFTFEDSLSDLGPRRPHLTDRAFVFKGSLPLPMG